MLPAKLTTATWTHSTRTVRPIHLDGEWGTSKSSATLQFSLSSDLGGMVIAAGA